MASFFPEFFCKQNIEVVVPNGEVQKLINHTLFSEIESGIFKVKIRNIPIEIIVKMVLEQKIDSLILGCTEYPLMLTIETYTGILI